MESLVPEEELDALEQIPLEERATALESVERRLRSYMETGPPEDARSAATIEESTE